MSTEREVLTREQRQLNMTNVLNAIGKEEQDVSVLFMAFTDIIQQQFYFFIESQSQSQAEFQQRIDRMSETIDQVDELLQKSGIDYAEDMLVLSSVMAMALNAALLRQQASGVSVKTQVRSKPTQEQTKPKKNPLAREDTTVKSDNPLAKGARRTLNNKRT